MQFAHKKIAVQVCPLKTGVLPSDVSIEIIFSASLNKKFNPEKFYPRPVSKMSTNAAQLCLIMFAVLLGLWSTRIDLTDLVYMATTRFVRVYSVFFLPSRIEDIRERDCLTLIVF